MVARRVVRIKDGQINFDGDVKDYAAIILSLALKSIWGNKMRSFLTMLGIHYWSGAVIITVSLVNGVNGQRGWRASPAWV